MSGPSSPIRGIVLLLAAVSLVPWMDGAAKHLAQSIPVTQITWARYAFGTALTLPFVLWLYGVRSLWVPRMGMQILRGGFLLAATFSFFYAIKFLPLAETLALVFIYPLLVTALSPWLLGEQVGWRRYLAVIIGFAGALIVIQPGTGLFKAESILGIIPGLFFTGYIILTRKLAASAPAPVTLAYGTLLGAFLLSLTVPAVWQPPSPADWLWFMSLGLIASISHLMMIKAYEAAPASLLAPLGYAEMPMAVFVGWVWFDEWPDPWVWLGIFVIIGSGVFISMRERQRQSQG